MQATSELKPSKSTQALAFLFYLIGGMLIFFLGANTFDLFPTNRNLTYEWGITAIFLFLAILMRKKASLQGFSLIASALFLASAANAVNLSLGNFVGRLFHQTSEDMLSLSLDKVSQSIPIILVIILLTLWQGGSLGELFLKKGNLRQGLRFGLISFAAWAVIFIVVVVIQAQGPVTQGLFGSGISVNTIVSALPWILLFCFTNGFMEELWFRGVSLRKLTPMLGPTSSIIVTALVFGATHSAATYITPVQMLLFVLIVISLGLVNAYVMLKTDSIWGSVFFHAGYDLLTIIPILTS